MLWLCLRMFAFLLTVIVVATTCMSRAARQKWWGWLIGRRNTVGVSSRTPEDRESIGCGLSKSEEDKLRDIYLIDKLSKFTKSLSADDIKNQTIQDVSADDEESDSASSGRQDGFDVEKSIPVTEERPDADGCILIAETKDRKQDFLIVVPVPGQPYCQDVSGDTRLVPNGCAICISAFDPQDQITWSSNKDCNHVFHHDCILDWFKRSARLQCWRPIRHEHGHDALTNSASNSPMETIVSFQLMCPSCRQDFIVVDGKRRAAKPALDAMTSNGRTEL